MATSTTNTTVRCHALSSNKPPMSTFGTPSSTSSPQSPEQPLLQAFLFSFDGTPITSSSASQQGGEQTQKLVEGRVFEEIRGCTYQNVEGFFSKYFEGKPWTERTLWYVQCSICGLFNTSYVVYSVGQIENSFSIEDAIPL